MLQLGPTPTLPGSIWILSKPILGSISGPKILAILLNRIDLYLVCIEARPFIYTVCACAGDSEIIGIVIFGLLSAAAGHTKFPTQLILFFFKK